MAIPIVFELSGIVVFVSITHSPKKGYFHDWKNNLL